MEIRIKCECGNKGTPQDFSKFPGYNTPLPRAEYGCWKCGQIVKVEQKGGKRTIVVLTPSSKEKK